MRTFDNLTTAQKKEVLYACAYVAYWDVQLNGATNGFDRACEIGEGFEINEEDFELIGITVFPTSGPPQRPS